MEETKNKIVALLSALFPTSKIYLYGSRARGDNTQTSDYDIAIDSGKEISRFKIAEAKSILEATNIPCTVDVVDFHSIPEEMKHNIEREKVVWKD